MSPWFALPGKLENQIRPILMKPNEKFLKKPKAFRESVRSISQAVGYSKDGKIIAPKVRQIPSLRRTLKTISRNVLAFQATGLSQG